MFRPLGPPSAWFVNTGSPPSLAVGSGYIDMIASTSIDCVLFVESLSKIESVIVGMRSFSGTSTLGLYKSNAPPTVVDAYSVNPITLSGGGTTINVTADGNHDLRTLTLQTPTALSIGQFLVLRAVTPGGVTARLSNYLVRHTAVA